MRPTTVAGSVPLTARCPVRPSSIVRSIPVLLSDADRALSACACPPQRRWGSPVLMQGPSFGTLRLF